MLGQELRHQGDELHHHWSVQYQAPQHAAASSASELVKQQQAVAQLRDNLAAKRAYAVQLAADKTRLQAHLSVAQRNSSQASAHACKLAASNAALQGEHKKLQEHAASLQATLAEAGVMIHALLAVLRPQVSGRAA